jgi:hypothetical protein
MKGSLLDISGEDIAQLGDKDLRSLVARLCEAEMRQRDLPTSSVTAGGEQEAKDGGRRRSGRLTCIDRDQRLHSSRVDRLSGQEVGHAALGHQEGNAAGRKGASNHP